MVAVAAAADCCFLVIVSEVFVAVVGHGIVATAVASWVLQLSYVVFFHGVVIVLVAG